MDRRTLWIALVALLLTRSAFADPPIASYLYPAGGQRGTTVAVRIGGLNLNAKAAFEMLGPGVEVPPEIRRTETTWLEGPLLPLPDSQQAEDYPKDYSACVTIATKTPVGPRACRVWTSQGASGSLPFVVGEYPEIVEQETVDISRPVPVTLPITLNGRIFPREDVDLWSFPLKAGEVFSASVDAGRLGSPLDPWVEAFSPAGRRLAEIAPAPYSDGRLVFLAPETGIYTLKIHDLNVKGSQAHVYRMTLTTGPSIDTFFPLGGRRGDRVPFRVHGLGLPATPDAVTLTSEGAGRGPQPAIVTIPGCGAAVVEVDDLAEVSEREPNDEADESSHLELPGIGNGRIGREGDVDIWAISLVKGTRYEIDLRAARLGSRLDGLLKLTDAAGKELSRAEGTAAQGGDPTLSIMAPATGSFYLHVNDRFRSRGGPAWAYRLRVTETPAPDFRLFYAADTLTVLRGGVGKLKLEARRIGGFSEPIAMETQGFPDGVSTSKAIIASNATAVELTFKADAMAPIRSARFSIRGTAKINGREQERIATLRGLKGLPEILDVRLAVALPTPFKIVGLTDFGWAPRGSVRRRRYKIERNGFTGPLEIQLADRQARHLQGVTGPVLTVPANADEFDYPVTLPPWMEIGRTSRAVVRATGVIRDRDGSEHEVGYSSPSADVQVIAVIGPGLIGLEASRTSVAVAPGRTLDVAVKVARSKQTSGPVRIEMIAPSCVKGILAEPLILDSGQTEGVVRIRCDAIMSCPGEAQTLLRASAVVGGDPATAETTLRIVPEITTSQNSAGTETGP